MPLESTLKLSCLLDISTCRPHNSVKKYVLQPRLSAPALSE